MRFFWCVMGRMNSRVPVLARTLQFRLRIDATVKQFVKLALSRKTHRLTVGLLV